jgi:hypothetical protein
MVGTCSRDSSLHHFSGVTSARELMYCPTWTVMVTVTVTVTVTVMVMVMVMVTVTVMVMVIVRVMVMVMVTVINSHVDDRQWLGKAVFMGCCESE